MKSLLIIIVATLGLGGCVIVPFPMPSKTQAEHFEKNDFSFIEDGETTQAEIKAQLYEPQWAFTEPVRWVYLMRKYTGGRWNACIAFGTFNYGDVDCGPISDGETRFKLLEVEFDDAGIVAKTRVSKVGLGDCNRHDWCMSDDGILVADQNLD